MPAEAEQLLAQPPVSEAGSIGADDARDTPLKQLGESFRRGHGRAGVLGFVPNAQSVERLGRPGVGLVALDTEAKDQARAGRPRELPEDVGRPGATADPEDERLGE